MKKPLIEIPANSEVKVIPNTSYVIIADKYVARLLTPSVKNGKTYFSVTIKKEAKPELIDDLNRLTKK